MKLLTLHLYPLMAFVSLLGTVAIPAHSQPIIPATDGTGTTVNQNGNQFNIQGGTRSSNGANLFHSFSQFNVESSQTANFLTTPDIRNILGRVTGGNASTINGLIQVVGGNSNLFLMNPTGIIFGPNARLNVPASFSVTTATGIGFNGNNFWFKAMGTNDYSNLVGNPSGYHFDVSNPGAVVNEGNLSLNPGNNLTLAGGTVVNTGELSTAGGNITIAAVNGGDTLRISQPGHVLSLDVSPSSANLSGESITPLSLAKLLTGGDTNDASSVIVDAQGNLVLTDREGVAVASGNIDVSTTSTPPTPPLSKGGQGGYNGGQINVLGDRVAVIDANIQANGLNGGGRILIGGDFQGDGIVPNSQQTFVNNNSFISADAINNENGGQVIIWSNDTTNFAGNISAKGGEFYGDGGFVEISGKQQLIFDGNVNVSAALGEPGKILFDPKNIIVGAETPNQNEEDNQTFSAAEIEGLEGEIILQADNDITVNQPIETSESIELKAGRSININADIDTSSGNSNIALFGNDDGADINNRDSGAASINQREGTTLNAGSGDITILLGNLGENGDINLANLTTTGQLLVNANRGNISRVSPNSLISADRAIFETQDISGVGLAEAPLRIDVNNLEVFTGEKGLFIESINNLTIGGVSEEVEGISTFAGGNIEISINGNLTATEQIITSAPDRQPGNITISSSGNIDTTQTTINANSELTSGGDISLSANGDIKTGGIDVSTGGNNRGGNVTINSGGEVDTTGGEIFSASLQADGGTVTITSNNDLKTGYIDSRSDGSGNGGDITLESTGGNVDTSSEELASFSVGGNAGNVSITSQGNIKTGDIFSSAGEPLDVGGDLEGSSPFESNNNNSNQTQSANGSGGDITLTAEGTIDTSAGTLESFSRLGGGGTVSITSRGDITTGAVFSTAGEPDVGDPANNNTTTTQTEINASNSGNIRIESTEGAVTTTDEIDTIAVSGNAGSVTIKAFGDIKTENIQSSTFAGEGGNVTIESTSGSIDTTGVAGDARISSLSTQGNAGNVIAKSNGNLITGNIDSNSENGRGGNITLESTGGNIDTSRGELASSSSSGNAGSISLTSQGNITTGNISSFAGRDFGEAENSENSGSGDGGDITLNAGGNIDTTAGTEGESNLESFSRQGSGGNIILEAKGDITTDRILSTAGDPENSNTTTITQTEGNGASSGDISIKSTEGTVTTTAEINSFATTGNGGSVTVESFGDLNIGNEINSRSDINGSGGDIILESQTGAVTIESELSSSSQTGNGGNVDITAPGDIQVATIFSSSEGNGQGGNITLESTGGNVDTSSGELGSFSLEGDAGNVTIKAVDNINAGEINSLTVVGQGGDITIESTGGNVDTVGTEENTGIFSSSIEGDAGKITITSNGNLTTGDIDSRSEINGQGGDITLKSTSGKIDTSAGVLASFSGTGDAGNIDISSNGDLTTGEIFSSSGDPVDSNNDLPSLPGVTEQQTTNSNSGENTPGRGGSITLRAEGKIDTTAGVLQSFSREGSGGSITLEAKGNITTSEIISSAADPEDRPAVGGENSETQTITQSQVEEQTGRQSGNIKIESTEGTVTTQGEIISYSNQGNAGNIDVISNGDVNIADGTSIDSRADTSGNGGAIKIESQTGAITINSELSSSSQTGNGGNVEIIARDNINTETISSFSEGNGQGGSITLESTDGNVDTSGGELSSFSELGNAGDVKITSSGNLRTSSIDSRSNGSGEGGSITLESTSGNVDTSRGELSSFSELGNAGDVKITSSGNLRTSSIDSRSNGSGEGGSITLESTGGNVDTSLGELRSFSELGNAGGVNITSSGNLRTSSIDSRSNGNGQGGNIILKAEGKIDAGAIESFSRQGQGGNITLISEDDINISSSDGEAGINSEAKTSSDGGNIKIESKTGAITINSELSSSSGEGNGGDLEITAPRDIQVGTISSSSEGNGRGGDIAIESTSGGVDTSRGELGSFSRQGDAGDVNITSSGNLTTGNIDSRSDGNGQGGSITLESTSGNVDTTRGELRSSSLNGNAGSVSITSPGNIKTDNISSFAGIPFNEEDQSESLSSSQDESGTGNGGDITLNAGGTIEIEKGDLESFSRNGNGGNIDIIATGDITTGKLLSTAGDPEGPISETETNSGSSGDITVESAEGSVNVLREINSLADFSDGGDVTITSHGDISIDDEINSRSDRNGKGGNILLESTTGGIDIGKRISSKAGDGEGGAVTLSSQGNIQTAEIESFSSNGTAGHISITATGNITTSDILSSAGNPDDRPPVRNNGENATITQSQVGEAEGNPGGNITIQSIEGTVTSEGELVSYSDRGYGGNVTIISNGDINIVDVDSRADNRGRGGEIFIESQTGTINTINGQLASSSRTGDGGNVDIISAGNIEVENIFSFSEGNGNGGDVNITGNSDVKTATIGSFAEGSGQGGNISIFADGAIDTSIGELSSFSAEGEGGDVTLSATTNITTGFIESFSGGGTRGGNITLETTNGNIDTTVGFLDEEANISSDADVSSADVATIFAEERANLSSFAPGGSGGNITIIQQGQGEITTSNISSFGGEDSGAVNIINNDGNINTGVIFSTAINGAGGQISVETMNNGDLNINHIATYGDAETATGGDISLDASGSVNINNVASFGNAGSGDVSIQSSSGSINTGTIQTRAPNGTSGNITLNTFSTEGDIRTASVTTQGGAAAGQVEIIAADGSVTTEDLESSSESGSAGGINVVAGEDIETGDQTAITSEGDATINNEAGGDITTGDQTAITSEGDATINNEAGGDITTGDQTAITSEGDATINNE
ncbi:MAG: filamentous hemagglutinin N-terminal domain-containing protein, partial [Okeania sp. SIO2F4]|uniref:two-partner secretion domain-containing protein n=1 Tax=Okeania sp. SIO2F4 TaxID=2607790 RepID=UPI00142C53B2